jgi:hypothetical protein
MTQRIKNLLADAAIICACDVAEFSGQRVKDLLRAIEGGEVRILWGLWTREELETVIRPTETPRGVRAEDHGFVMIKELRT